jgi:hypothetical protein
MRRSNVTIDLGELTSSCFVVMPFKEDFDDLYATVVRAAVERAGLTCVRGDEISSHSPVMHEVWGALRRALVVIAVLSESNANVMYEVGLAHAMGKPVVIVAREGACVPVALQSFPWLYYNDAAAPWKDAFVAETSATIMRVLKSYRHSPYLTGVAVTLHFPRLLGTFSRDSPECIGGSWHGDWVSLRNQCVHKATLVIPQRHGADFVATMTVTYELQAQVTNVRESLRGRIRADELYLEGTSVEYVQRGASTNYSPDRLELVVAPDGLSMSGVVGAREVTFERRG